MAGLGWARAAMFAGGISLLFSGIRNMGIGRGEFRLTMKV